MPWTGQVWAALLGARARRSGRCVRRRRVRRRRVRRRRVRRRRVRRRRVRRRRVRRRRARRRRARRRRSRSCPLTRRHRGGDRTRVGLGLRNVWRRPCSSCTSSSSSSAAAAASTSTSAPSSSGSGSSPSSSLLLCCIIRFYCRLCHGLHQRYRGRGTSRHRGLAARRGRCRSAGCCPRRRPLGDHADPETVWHPHPLPGEQHPSFNWSSGADRKGLCRPFCSRFFCCSRSDATRAHPAARGKVRLELCSRAPGPGVGHRARWKGAGDEPPGG